MNEAEMQSSDQNRTDDSKLNIKVKTMDSSVFSMEVPANGRVNDLKQKIEEVLISLLKWYRDSKFLNQGRD